MICSLWFDKFSEDSESDDIPFKRVGHHERYRRFTFVLSDSVVGIFSDSAAAKSLSKGAP